MVVDDEADNLDLLYRTFRREFEVFKAESAFTALQILEQEEEMAIIISDQRMPKMNGTEFLSIAAEQFPDTIRILLTGYTDVEDLVGAINTGKVFKYITKPWNPDDLKNVVQQASDTYRVLKQRTNELNRALRRESLFNAVTTAIRESLDYCNMLQTIAETLGQTFIADACILRPVEDLNRLTAREYRFAANIFSYFSEHSEKADLIKQLVPTGIEQSTDYDPLKRQAFLAAIAENRKIQHNQSNGNDEQPLSELLIPLAYQQELLAVISLYKHTSSSYWSAEEIQLLEEVAQQAALAISQAKLYQQIQQQTEQMRAELAVARQIQTNLLRQSWPQLETVNIQACCHPAREVGGDFFEVYVHPQGDIWLAVGDVSGKGVPAALFMASAISVLRRELSQETTPSPDELMKNLNSTLSEDLVGSNCFITMVLARYNPTEKLLTYANAGHVYPLVWSKTAVEKCNGSDPHLAVEPNYLKVRGVPLGILPVWRATAGTLALTSGDILLLISDGITEATVPYHPSDGIETNNSMLKQTGLWKILLQQGSTFDLATVLARIQMYNQVQEDDQTLLSLEVL
jgi:serine phosphatase RsbU (regulator of sigma subunit)/FixJ family two-component response regulator